MTGPATARRSTVLLGGPSAEHDVSIVSGTAIAEALIGEGFEVRRSSSTSMGSGGGCPRITAEPTGPAPPTTTRRAWAPPAR